MSNQDIISLCNYAFSYDTSHWRFQFLYDLKTRFPIIILWYKYNWESTKSNHKSEKCLFVKFLCCHFRVNLNFYWSISGIGCAAWYWTRCELPLNLLITTCIKLITVWQLNHVFRCTFLSLYNVRFICSVVRLAR